MTLSSDERDAIVAYRIEKAETTLKEAQGIMQMEYWTVVANRLYYAAYYAVAALLIHNGLQAHTHAGVIRLFGKNFVSKGIISKEQNKLYVKLFELRQKGDYDDIYSISKEDVEGFIEPTKEFIEAIKSLIQK